MEDGDTISKIVLISCVSKKLPYRAKAKDLYTSTLFRLNLKYAEILNPDKIFILSAKHGLLNVDQEIDPYDLTLNTMKSKEIKSWSRMVINQLNIACNLSNDEIIFLAGNNYRKFLIPFITHYTIPLEGLRIGEQLHYLKEKTADGRDM